MTKNEYYTIKGYIDMLEKAVPNGRHIHQIKNKLQALKLSLETQTSVLDAYEKEIKDLINELYDQNPVKKNTDV